MSVLRGQRILILSGYSDIAKNRRRETPAPDMLRHMVAADAMAMSLTTDSDRES